MGEGNFTDAAKAVSTASGCAARPSPVPTAAEPIAIGSSASRVEPFSIGVIAATLKSVAASGEASSTSTAAPPLTSVV